jgi:hypothetical protein
MVVPGWLCWAVGEREQVVRALVSKVLLAKLLHWFWWVEVVVQSFVGVVEVLVNARAVMEAQQAQSVLVLEEAQEQPLQVIHWWRHSLVEEREQIVQARCGWV